MCHITTRPKSLSQRTKKQVEIHRYKKCLCSKVNLDVKPLRVYVCVLTTKCIFLLLAASLLNCVTVNVHNFIYNIEMENLMTLLWDLMILKVHKINVTYYDLVYIIANSPPPWKIYRLDNCLSWPLQCCFPPLDTR